MKPSVRKIISFHLMLGYSGNQIVEVLKILHSFLKSSNIEKDFLPKEPDKVPLRFTKEGLSKLHETLLKFSNVYETGIAAQEDPDFLYLLGQFLTVVAMKIDSLQTIDPTLFEKYEPLFKNLFHVWGIEKRMNARYLHVAYRHEGNESARDSLLDKITDSITIAEKFSAVIH